MDSALIVSSTEKGTAFFTELLGEAAVKNIVALKSCAEARRLLLERDFDIVLINAPLQDETGEKFARNVSVKGFSQVILIVQNEYFDAVTAACESDGVLTIAKPVNRALFWTALQMAKSLQSKMMLMQAENAKLKQKIEDIRVVDRAKWILVSQMNMSEQDAHRFIEKQAMDMRKARREIAESILKTYET